MDRPPIDWKKDSRSFNTVAELYDRYRPGYPDSLVEQILSAAGLPADGQILEIGSGTGKATRLFAQRGYSILCIEPGENLVQVARQNLKDFPKVQFRLAAFEDWEGEGKLFDLVISAQAFHWVPKEIRYRKAAELLKPEGCLALFWNRALPLEYRLYQKLNQMYISYAPEIASSDLKPVEEFIQHWTEEIEGSETFHRVEVKRVPWKESYTTQQYLGLLSTHSDHIRLPEDVRKRLFAGIAEVLQQEGGQQAGGRIEKPYEAVAFIARKRSQ